MRQPLGQHFLRADKYVHALVDAVHLSKDDTVLEIGPGEGVLTKALLETGACVHAIEKDTNLVARLNKRFEKYIENGQLVVVSGDVRNTLDENLEKLPNGYVVISNIPYYLTGGLIRELLTHNNQPSRISLLIQKEVAERAVSKSSKESLLSIGIKAYGEPHYITSVPRGAFAPPPDVDSAIIVIENISRERFVESGIDEDTFFVLARTAFGQKRKQVQSTLGAFVGRDIVLKALRKTNLPETVRPEEISIDQWFLLANLLR